VNRDFMAQLGQMQERLAKAQRELEERVAEGSAGGGAVKVAISGGLKVQSLQIDPEVVDPSDVAMLEDLVTAAVNEALQQVQGFQMGQLAGLAGGLNIPGLGGLEGAGGALPEAPRPNRAARRARR
jgi:DNA-binding YbaB/EbfC family protein